MRAAQGQGLEGILGPWVGDTSTVRGVFAAVGPSFKNGIEIELLRNVNLHPLVAALLGIIPSAPDAACIVADRALRAHLKGRDGR
ncbi:MAG: hypothetical protein B7Y43_03910 [Sphingomonas sp. 28-62-20]|uniref:hypothetical protein n=1 Tax=Sphingomonas sp. 28-62-20 TaxID=1970433 RepID=UPI000BDC4CEF|nr:MAG: hypothetical protein B7Y43_03910 [Sphingomonas sp. 28-62-20]